MPNRNSNNWNNSSMFNDINNFDKSINHKDNLASIKIQLEQKYKLEETYRRKIKKLEGDLDEKQLDKLKKLEEQYNKKLAGSRWSQRKKELQDEIEMLNSASSKIKLNLISTAESVGKSVGKGLSSLNNSIDTYLTQYSSYMSVWNTRLQGTDKTYSSITKLVDRAIGMNAYVTQSKVLEKLNTYVQEGIAYNVEQRAFLGTVSEKIAATFDAANGTLLQLIRIQQADSTAARLGMESTLTQLLNSMYSDTSYLNGLSDSVSAAILQANSQLSRDGSLSFEYSVQKWLGSMSSVGVSDSTIQSIAQGINSLATGEVNALSSNTSLQNLLVMAANSAGLDYSTLLTGGMNANTTNQLLQGLVTYLQSLAQTQNQVVKSQYANLFGVTISDLTSLLNLSTQDLNSIANNMLSYYNATAETEYQLTQLSSRTSTAQKVENVLNNVMSSVGEGIANNVVSYTTWLMTDLVEKATGGINIPTIGAFGNFIDLNATVTQLMKTGIVGISTLSKIGTILSGFSKIGSLSLDDWGATETTGRGRGLDTTISDLNTGISTTTSQTAYIGNSSGSDMYSSSITAAKEDAQSQFGGEEDTVNLDDLIKEDLVPDVKSILNELQIGNDYLNELKSIFSSFGFILP